MARNRSSWPRHERLMLRVLFTVVLLGCHTQSMIATRCVAQSAHDYHEPVRSVVVEESAPWGLLDFSHRLRERDWKGSPDSVEKQQGQRGFDFLPPLLPRVDGMARFVVARTRIDVGHLRLCDRAKHERSGVALI